MDLRKEVQKLLDEELNVDEDQTDMLKAAACLLAVVETTMAKARERRIRGERKSVGERHKYGMNS